MRLITFDYSHLFKSQTLKICLEEGLISCKKERFFEKWSFEVSKIWDTSLGTKDFDKLTMKPKNKNPLISGKFSLNMLWKVKV